MFLKFCVNILQEDSQRSAYCPAPAHENTVVHHPQDRYAYGMTTPVVDISQDVVVEGGYQNDTHTVMRFSRPWNTCDTEHDMKLSVREPQERRDER